MRIPKMIVQPFAVLLVLCYVLITLNLIGFPWYAQSGDQWGGNHFGWPLTYRSGQWTEAQAFEAVEYRKFLHGMSELNGFISPVFGPWSATGDGIRPARLLLNLFFCCGIFVTSGLLMIRFGSRRDDRWFQRSLPGALSAAATIALYTYAVHSKFVYYFVVLYRDLIDAMLVLSSAIAIMVGFVHARSQMLREP